MTERTLLVFDIDGTQLPERKNPIYEEGERAAVVELKYTLDDLAMHGDVVIAHVSNGMYHLFEPVSSQLAIPHYLSCNASTEIYKNKNGNLVIDNEFNEEVRACDFDPEFATELINPFGKYISSSGPEHQTSLKSSFTFHAGVTLAERQNIFRILRDKTLTQKSGTGVFYVEGGPHPNDPRAVIDFLPKICTKSGVIDHLLKVTGIPAENVLVAGNGDNDISMFRAEFMGIAVANAQDALKDHVRKIQAFQGSDRHVIAEGNRSKGLLEGLRYFKII